MDKNVSKRDFDVKFETVDVVCPRCGNRQKEVIIVSRHVGILDTSCNKCKKRIVELKVFD